MRYCRFFFSFYTLFTSAFYQFLKFCNILGGQKTKTLTLPEKSILATFYFQLTHICVIQLPSLALWTDLFKMLKVVCLLAYNIMTHFIA